MMIFNSKTIKALNRKNIVLKFINCTNYFNNESVPTKKKKIYINKKINRKIEE